MVARMMTLRTRNNGLQLTA